EFIETSRMKFLSSQARFLAVLGEAHRQKTSEFNKVLAIRGRERLYFAKSEREISASGYSTHPKKIPGTEYWAMTNASNAKKRQILRNALRALGFSNESSEAARTLLR